MTDYTLIQNCQKNDRAAQKQLFELNYGRLMALCMRYSKNSEQAKDMLVKGFAKLCTAISGYKKEEDFDAWMMRNMVEFAVSYLRERRQEYFITSTVRLAGEEKKVEFDLFHQQLEPDERMLTPEHYLQALQMLPPSFRAVYNMTVIDALSTQEVARCLEISENTCQYNLAKAKDAFYKNLQQIQSEAA